MKRHGFRPAGKPISEYQTWVQMRSRCFNPKDARFKNYGARGIKVCERWDNFAAFISDMGFKPSPKHSIDRIDNDGNYNPSNCRWATSLEQMHNRRIAKLTDLDVEVIRCATGSQRSIGRRFGISQSMVSRIKSGEYWKDTSTDHTHQQRLEVATFGTDDGSTQNYD